MSKFQVLLLAALVVVASANLLHLVRPAVAQVGGPYQLMNHSNTSANVGVFRIDTSTGNVSYCYLGGGADLKCTAEVR